jgi:hypothetical protein
MTALPDGCSIVVDLEAIDLLEQLAGGPTSADQLDQLIQEWTELHDDLRPTATEVSLVTGKSLDLKKFGGWFGFLKSHGHLDNNESVVFDLVQDFLLEVEHGAYTKSFKLITLQAMLDLDGFEHPKTAEEIAHRSKEIIFKDPRLLNELSNAVSQFVDVWDPKPAEWLTYWRKNPLNAWLNGGGRGSDHWFELVGDEFRFKVTMPENYMITFKDLLSEIVEYRLHRYLLSSNKSSSEEILRPVSDDGDEIDSEFVVRSVLDRPVAVHFRSAGDQRNKGYVDGMDLVLKRLGAIRAVINDAFVDSLRLQSTPIADRRLNPGQEDQYPIDLYQIKIVTNLRASWLRHMRSIGRKPTAKEKGGNNRKAMTILLSNVQQYSANDLAKYLAGQGPAPTAASRRSAVA